MRPPKWQSCLRSAVADIPTAANISANSAVGDVNVAVGVLWFPAVVTATAVVGFPAVSVVPTVAPSTCICTSSGVWLLSAFPDVPVLLCAGVDPAALVVNTAVDVPEILAVATTLLLPSLFC